MSQAATGPRAAARQSADELVAAATAALNDGNAETLGAVTRDLRAQQPFLSCLLNDTLETALRRAQHNQPVRQFSDVIRTRVKSLENWQQAGNQTVAAIEAGEIDAEGIKPHVRLEAAAYDAFYADQSERIGRQLRHDIEHEEEAPDEVEFGLGPNVNHAFRRTHAVALIETLLGLAQKLDEAGGTIRWLDIGCGTGNFANSANPRRYGVQQWEIVGCDLQAGKIAVANRRKAKDRSFFASDAFEMLEKYRARNESFHLVSMFEFLEHLDDPLKLIRQLDRFSPKFVLAASPLAQKIGKALDAQPDRAHLWSFSRRAWEQMFALAGFNVVYSSEVRVGSYIGGMDWLSIVCGPVDDLRSRRQAL